MDVLKQQSDLEKINLLSKGRFKSTYRAEQQKKGTSEQKLIQVIHNISPHFQIRREKDLLHYLNRFPEFIRFEEIRRDNFKYLQFFEYKSTQTLKEEVKSRGELSDSDSKQLLDNIVSSLEKLHQVGFVHANISPETVLASKRNQFYLFGMEKSIPSLPSFEAELINGNHRYSAPERLNGILTSASDIYSLGCTLYFALTGNHIFRLNKSKNVMQQFWAHTHHSIRKVNRLPVLWRYLLIWMTHKDPSKRITLPELKKWIEEPTFPSWIRKAEHKPVNSYPENILEELADEHYLYPTFKQALNAELDGDLITAFNLYENCAFKGYSRAENNLGLMYEKGVPIKQSYLMAANMYKHAFEKGNPHAALNLGRLFEVGKGVPKNEQKAFKLYEFSAMRGNLNAQNKLGELFRIGKGTKQDVEKSKYWFSVAAYYGNKEALENLKTSAK